MTDAELQAILERAAKATPGPWSFGWLGEEGDGPVVTGWRQGLICRSEPNRYCHANTMERVVANLDFIAHARENVPALLEAVGAAKAEIESIRLALKGMRESDLESLAYAVMRDADACAEWAQRWLDREAEIGRVQTALTTIQDYAGDSPGELNVAQELLDDIRKVAGKALKPEEQQEMQGPEPLAPNPSN
jgi:hypothetical protein